jgi:hypothetical protein
VLTDPAEEAMARVGLVNVEDAASGHLDVYDFGSAGARRYQEAQEQRNQTLQTLFKRSGVSHIEVKTNDLDYAAPLLNYFKIRARRS